MIANRTNNLRAAPTTTVAELQDVLADRARGYHDITVRASQLRYEPELGMIEAQGHRDYGPKVLVLNQCVQIVTRNRAVTSSSQWPARPFLPEVQPA